MEQPDAAEPGFRKMNNRARYAAPSPCATVSCGEDVERGSIYCSVCRARQRKRAAWADARPEGPTNDHELDVASYGLRDRAAGKAVVVETHPCAHPDCGQPALRGRLYCSGRCRSRSRKDPALFTIDGLTMTLREHADRVDLDIATVYCRMRAGDSAEDAIKRPLDDEMQRRRLCG